ncbi:hypothetical protein KM043_005624 [Ampulex compressa]|nr:hypothetical protein KM043_005624 [Ampulex compressa]
MIQLEHLIIYGAILVIFLAFLFCIFLYTTTQPYPKVWRHEKEKVFHNFSTKSMEKFPSLQDDWSVHLSVIIPAYNEEERLPPMLDECLEYLEKREKLGLTYELIIVNDGSTDKTVSIVEEYAVKYKNIKMLSLVKNRGKGGAVRLGMLSARGSVILFADADGATKFKDLEKLEASLKDVLNLDYTVKPEEVSMSNAVICGSRAHLEKEETAKRSFFRLFLMHGFHFLVYSLCDKIESGGTRYSRNFLTKRSSMRRLWWAIKGGGPIRYCVLLCNVSDWQELLNRYNVRLEKKTNETNLWII